MKNTQILTQILEQVQNKTQSIKTKPISTINENETLEAKNTTVRVRGD